MNELILYVHGKDGSPAECEHYKPLFPDCEVVGLDYRTFSPWETGREIRDAVERLRARYDGITLIANSIGAYFSMCAGIDGLLRRAYFISPIVDMERLLLDILAWSGATERELEQRGTIPTSFGEELSWTDLCRVRAYPIRWRVPTAILYGGRDELTKYETVAAFAAAHNAELTVMPDGEHWFHTEDQMQFLDRWIKGEL